MSTNLNELLNYIKHTTTNYGNTSSSPLPTSAFPMDARTYFESYSEAEYAASIADIQGSTTTVYYFGMSVVVYENDEVKEYIIVKGSDGVGKLKEKLFLEDLLCIDGGNAQDADPESFKES